MGRGVDEGPGPRLELGGEIPPDPLGAPAEERLGLGVFVEVAEHAIDVGVEQLLGARRRQAHTPGGHDQGRVPLADQRFQTLGDQPDRVGLEAGEVQAREGDKARRAGGQGLLAQRLQLGLDRLRDQRVESLQPLGELCDVGFRTELAPIQGRDLGVREERAQPSAHGIGLAVADHLHFERACGCGTASGRLGQAERRQPPLRSRNTVGKECVRPLPCCCGFDPVTGRLGGFGQAHPGADLLRPRLDIPLQVRRRLRELARRLKQIGHASMDPAVVGLGLEKPLQGGRLARMVAERLA